MKIGTALNFSTMEITKTDAGKIIAYLSDAADLYEALGVPPVQKYVSRAHMIRELIAKLTTKIERENTKRP